MPPISFPYRQITLNFCPYEGTLHHREADDQGLEATQIHINADLTTTFDAQGTINGETVQISAAKTASPGFFSCLQRPDGDDHCQTVGSGQRNGYQWFTELQNQRLGEAKFSPVKRVRSR